MITYMCVFLSTLSHKVFQQNWKINWESKATLQLVVVFSTLPQGYAMLDVVTFHSQPIISFNALLSFLLKLSTDLEGILGKKLLRKKVPNCTKFKTPFKICVLFLLIWKIGGLIKFFLGGQRICIHLLKLRKLETCFKHFCTFKKQLVRDFVWNFWNFCTTYETCLKHVVAPSKRTLVED